MSWSFADARRVAAEVRGAEHGRRARDTVRPRGVVGMVRARGPLPLLLYVAARDGLLVRTEAGGFAVLEPPLVDGAPRSGGYRQRMLRLLDRQWERVVLAAPLLMVVPISLLAVVVRTLWPVAIGALLLGMAWIALVLISMLVHQFGWVPRWRLPSHGSGRAAGYLPGYHWSVPLVHEPDPRQADALMRRVLDQVHRLVLHQAQMSVRGKVVLSGEMAETPVVLLTGVTTQETAVAIRDTLRRIEGYDETDGVVALRPTARPVRRVERPIKGSGFLLLYVAAIAILVVVLARFVADAESSACGSLCAGRPATYRTAVQWLLQRLLFSDPPGLSPGTIQVTMLGWLMSIASAMGFIVAGVAFRQEYMVNRWEKERSEEVVGMRDGARVLILVVTPGEHRAVTAAVHRHTKKAPVSYEEGPRTAFFLGSLGGTETYLAQAGEQGSVTAAGMLVSAIRLIEQLDPDHVILTGICFGLREDEGQQPGDVVVSRRVQDVDHRKVEGGAIVNRGVNVGCSPFLLDRFQAAQYSWTASRVHIGTILSSSTLVNSRALVEELKTRFPDAIAGEMEGVGVSEAAKEEFKPDWIVAKAISDWGYDKSDDHQELAARNAAEFVTEVIASGAIARRRPERRAQHG